MNTAQPPAAGRIASLDQFRGYTVAGMLLVNFIGGFQEVGAIWKHHKTYCSYADTIMPQFFFPVGFVVYHLDGKVSSWDQLRKLGLSGFQEQAFQREVFQTLVHIALASLW